MPASVTSTNPSRNFEVLGVVPQATPEQVSDAIARAKAAQPEWADRSLEQRCAAVASFGEVASQRAEEISQLVATETGRPIRSSRGSTAGALEYLDGYLAMAPEALAPRTTYQTDSELHQVFREPWGVVAAICPWNFPFMNVVWSCLPALLAGNTVVYKNSEENPLFTGLVAELVEASDLPKDTLVTLVGDGSVGELLARGEIDKLAFTGSARTGRYLAGIAAERFIPYTAELGGSNPGIVCEDVDLTDQLVASIFGKRFSHCGQICDATKRLIVHERHFTELTERLVALAATQRIGDACDEATDIGPLVAQRQVDLIHAQVTDALALGAQLQCGGRQPDGLRGAYYEPTILTNVTRQMRVWREETFGPVLPIVSFATEAEALELACDTTYGLGSQVYTNDRELFARLARAIPAGSVAQNSLTNFRVENPFGGFKTSGLGRTNGLEGFEALTQPKLVCQQR